MSPRRVLVFALAFAACAVLAQVEDSVPGAVGVRDATWQAFHRVQGPLQPPEAVALVEVSREDLDALGRWPWPRTLTAELL